MVLRRAWPLSFLAATILNAQLIIQTVAGGGPNNVPALQANLFYPWGVAADASGNFYVSSGVRVYRIDPAGVLTVFAGSGINGYGGDGGPATGASLSNPKGLAVDGQGNLYIADEANNRIRKVTAGTGIITTVAGDGTNFWKGDGGSATSAGLWLPQGVAVDSAGNIYIADTADARIRKVTAATGIITTVAGTGNGPSSGDGGPALNAGLSTIPAVAVDSHGNIYIADGPVVRQVDASTGKISTAPGSGMQGAIAAVAVDKADNLYFVDSFNNAVRRVDAATHAISNVAVTTGNAKGVAVDGSGNLCVADYASQVVRKLSAGVFSVVAGNGMVGGYGGEGGPAVNASIGPLVPAVDTAGTLYFSDQSLRVLKVNIGTGIINAFAGNGDPAGIGGDGGPALSAQLNQPRAVATDSKGNVYITDAGFGLIRRVDANTNVITTYAGLPGGSFDDGVPATQAFLFYLGAIAFDSQDNLFVVAANKDTVPLIRKINAQTGIITTIAGGDFKFSGDGGPALGAGIRPAGMALDSGDNLFITGQSRVRRIDAQTGIITTVAGNGTPTIAGDGGPALQASLDLPGAIAVNSAGDFFIADGARIRKVTAADHKINTFAGNGHEGNSGEGGPPAAAEIGQIGGMAIDGDTLYLASYDRVRAIGPVGGCRFYLNKASAGFGFGAGTGSVNVSTTNGCGWSSMSNVPWVTITGGSSGSGSGTVAFSVAANSGTSQRSGTLTVAGRKFTVAQPAFAVTMSLSRTSVHCGSTGLSDVRTSPQLVALTFKGATGVSWTASASTSNIFLSPGSGTGNGILQISAASGSPNGVVTVIANGASNSPQQISVSVATVNPTPPIGSFDTPVDNTSSIVGAIPVTGWALDTIEITKVDIWREAVQGEAANGLIYIGDAVLVEGARPDVEGLYPNLPLSYRAGWGYQLLTNFLPQGNGKFKLHAIAHNKAGIALDLGTKTINVDNAHAAKPFGTLDTPTQGGTISGTDSVNFGWALTPQPAMIPTDGSTITVVIDGVPLGHPTYNQFRSDIANAFPGFANSMGAVGFFHIDTTTLANGIHTISWNAFDNLGRGEGLGSRYFNVVNTGGGTVAGPEDAILDATVRDGVRVRHEPDVNRQPDPWAPDAEGSYSVTMEEVGRIELHLGATTGEMLVQGESRVLPTGSTLTGGVFYWQPGPGFLGEYTLQFERPDGTRIPVRVSIAPKRYR